MDDLLKYENLFYDPEYFPVEEPIHKDPVDSCKHNWVNMETHIACCICGIVDIDRPILVADTVTKSKPKQIAFITEEHILPLF